MARPALEFCQPIADEIVRRISEGEDLSGICKHDPAMPSLPTVYKWLHANVAFANSYAHAREIQGELLAAQAQEIATRTHIELPNGMFVAADPMRDRLAVDTIKWRAAHLRPKVWGDKQQVELSGQLTLNDASEEDLLEELLALLASGRVRLPAGVEIVEQPDHPEDNSDLA